MMSAVHSTLCEIAEVNLSYLLLAQRLLQEDEATAMSSLGITKPMASVLKNLSTTQLAKLAASSQLLGQFRFDEHAILSSLARKEKQALTANSPSEIQA